MADLTANDVTYTELGVDSFLRRLTGGPPPRYKNDVQVDFGDGALTYPANGIPLSGTKMGMPEGVIDEIFVLTNLTPEYWTFDRVNNTIRGIIYTSGVEIATGAAVAATSLVLNVIGY